MERYRALYENAPVMLHSINREGRVLHVSDYWLEVMGYERDEVIGKETVEFLTDHSRKFMADVVFPQVLKSGECKDVPLRYARKDGSGIDVLLSIVGEREASDEVKRLMVVSVDVTERKRAEEQIRFQASLLAQVHSAVVATDRNREIIYWNEHAETLYQWPAAEVLGRNIVQVLISGDHREEADRIFRESELQGQWEGELLAVRKDGTPVPVFLTDSPIRDAGGSVIGFVGVSVDITERRRAERALQESEERYRKFFEEDLTGDYVARADGTLLSCNQAFVRIFGFSSLEDALSSNVGKLYRSPEEAEDFLEQLKSSRKLEYFEKDLVRKDGGQVRIVENAIGIFDEQGELLEYKVYVFDDTERKRLEDQLRQAQKMESIGTLASGIAHDFNNILNNVLGFAVQVQKHAGDPARVEKYGKTIEKSATRGAELSGQLLSFARVSKREKVPMDLADVVNEVVSLCSQTFPRSIEIQKSVMGEHLSVLGDRTELYQVLLNLCVNARDAIMEKQNGSGGLLTVEARPVLTESIAARAILESTSGRCVELTVRDNGTGIPDEIRDKIFDPFFTTKEKGKGTGLGLAMVYSVVRNHRGALIVESNNDSGTLFSIYLPSIDQQESVQVPIPKGNLRAREAENILVVDDEQSMLELARELLEEQGYSVLLAGSGPEAVEIFRERATEIDLVILDLVMPKMDGGQTYLRLKSINPRLSAFFCTGYMPSRVVGTLLEEENLKAIQKPFEPDAFLAMVRETIDAKHVSRPGGR
jgi:PAS domain S-box-containing protein